MKKMKMRSLAVVVLTVVVGVLAGCGNIQKFDGGAYTKACLDAMYKGEFEEYLKMTKISKEEAQEDYEEGIEATAEQFEEVGLSEKLVDQYERFFEELCKNTKYTIKNVEKDKNENFTVDIEIEPIQIFEGVGEEAVAQLQTEVDELVNAGTTPTDDEINEMLFQILCDALTAKLDHITYAEKQTVTVEVKMTEDRMYEISEEDLLKIDSVMYDVNNLKFE